MKNEISILLAVLLICAGLMACSPEKPESENAAQGKTGSTNELVIANTEANALPSQEEDFSEETKAKLKKLREEAAILKAEAELDTAKREAIEAGAAASTGASPEAVSGAARSLFQKDEERLEKLRAQEEEQRYLKKPMSTETFESNLKAVEQFGFLNKYSNKEELMHQMRNIFNAALINGETSASPERFEKIISDIESKLMRSGVSAQDTNEVRKSLGYNIAS